MLQFAHMQHDFHKLRKEYSQRALDESHMAADPMQQFKVWLSEAIASQLVEPNAMLLATSTREGSPSVRAVLLKEYDDRGLVFFTNYQSKKGRDLDENPKAALLFYWAELERQIRIEGQVEKVSRQESELYFGKRPRKAQIGAAASVQSAVLAQRSVLEAEAQRLEKLWEGQAVPCPEQWGGYLVRPNLYEFWQGRESRLHDRIVYRQDKGSWKLERLAP